MSLRPLLHFALLAALVPSGCASTTAKQKSLKVAVEDFGRGVRWGNWGQASAYMTWALQEQVRPGDADADIRVTDVALSAVVSHAKGGAAVTMAIEWYNLANGTIQRTMLRQSWQEIDGGWRIRAQKTVRGPEFPLLPSADPQAESGPGTDQRPGGPANGAR